MSTKIHVDDFGLSESSSKKIYDCIISNSVQSVSYMGNGLALKYSEKLLRDQVAIEKYLHLCLTEGKSLGHDYVYITDENNYFKIKFWKFFLLSFLPFLKYTKKIQKEIKAELRLQLINYNEIVNFKKFRIDSHQHIHMTPIVLNVLFDLKNEFDFNFIRIPKEYFIFNVNNPGYLINFFRLNVIKLLLLRFLTLISIKKIQKNKIEYNQNFSGLFLSCRMTAEFAQMYSEKYSNALIVFHPGKIENEEISTFWKNDKFRQHHYSKWRDFEYNELKKL